ncbi:hypothetical protein [Deinococcus sp. LM3]|uniref:hypothetical protein n=1 Tax=Deinococcus sp. LM3 TaxID=1938608 RepID=UPI0009C6EB03|nr:hypothetical protein [Deinococcus sp. LM3]OOV12391.1 hypothetical protein BXU09_16420 [Deinococcus sp. LM3]
MHQLISGERLDIRRQFGPTGLESLNLHLGRAPSGTHLWIMAAGPSGSRPAPTQLARTGPGTAEIRLGHAPVADVTRLVVGCSWRGRAGWTGTLTLASLNASPAAADLTVPAASGPADRERTLLLCELYLHDRRWRMRVQGEETRGGPEGAATLLGVPAASLRPPPVPVSPPAVSPDQSRPGPAAGAVPPVAAGTNPAPPPAAQPAAPPPPPTSVTRPTGAATPPGSPPPAAPSPTAEATQDSVLTRFQRAWQALLGPAEPAPPTIRATPDTPASPAQPGAVTARMLQDLRRRLDLIAQDLRPAAPLDVTATRLRVRHGQLLETHARILKEARDLEEQRGRLSALNLLAAQEPSLRAVENEIERAVRALQEAVDALATELVTGRLEDSRARLGAEDRYLRSLRPGGDRSLTDRSPAPATPPAVPGATPLQPPAARKAPAPDRPDPADDGLVIPWLNRDS